MFDNTTLQDVFSAVLYYGSPLLMLAGVTGFATFMTMWFIRK